MCFNSKYGLPFLALLIRSSLNLKKIKIVMAPNHGKIDSVAPEDYMDICLEHLSDIEIKYFGIKKPELEFLKLILAKSLALVGPKPNQPD
nr:hypothetical protein [Tanacetum cinerariifolium]